MRSIRGFVSANPRRRAAIALAGASFLALLVVAHIVVITVAVWGRAGQTRFAITLAVLWLASLVALALLSRAILHAVKLVQSGGR